MSESGWRWRKRPVRSVPVTLALTSVGLLMTVALACLAVALPAPDEPHAPCLLSHEDTLCRSAAGSPSNILDAAIASGAAPLVSVVLMTAATAMVFAPRALQSGYRRRSRSPPASF